MKPHSEAMRITKFTIEAMSRNVSANDSRFSFIILPTLQEIKRFRHQQSFRKLWGQMSSFLCSSDFECHDLMEYFQKVPFEQLDVVCDKWHFGPRTNQHASDAIFKTIFQ